jgi:aspartyl-tRNA(Asn)/glutamyl-tRNA(Gln) amidotransferase subunit A
VSTSPKPPALTRARFDQNLAEQRIVLSPEEAESVFGLAKWMNEGVAGLDVLGRAAGVAMPGDPPVHNPADLPIAEAGRRLRAGTLTSVALLDAHLSRIAERDPIFRAFYTLAADYARDAAMRADAELAAGHDRGPLHGIPVGIKDLIDVAGMPTTAGSKARAGHVATVNSAVADRLVAGGAVIVGKLATYEYGTVGPAYDTLFQPALNPWSVEHITGGSSSGSAVAVASGTLRTTLGSDTGGSVRGPASYCGVVGLKPTFGLVPKTGAIGLAPSMDHIGPMSASTADAAVTLDVIAGLAGPQSAASLLGTSIAGLRIGYGRNWFAQDSQVMPEVVAAMDEALSQLSLLGANIEEVELPDYFAGEAAGAAILHYEAWQMHRAHLASEPQGYGRKTFQTLASGIALSETEYRTALAAGAVLRQRLDDEVFSRFDALITVSALTTALPVSLFGKGAVWTPMRTIGFNVTGHPVLALPIGLAGGLPMGMQVIGRHHAEARICQIGDAFERATGHSDKRPPALS